MKSAVDEISCYVHQQRPINRVGHHQPNSIPAQQRNEILALAAHMTDLDRVSDRQIRFDLQPRAPLQPLIVSARQCRSLTVSAWQQIEKRLKLLRIERELRRKLPKNRPQLPSQPQHSLREEVCQRLFRVCQLQHVREIPRALHGKNEIVWCFIKPLFEALRSLKRIERTVQLDGAKVLRGEFEFPTLGQALGIKVSTPPLVAPARYSDPYPPTTAHAFIGRTKSRPWRSTLHESIHPSRRRMGFNAVGRVAF